MKFNSFICQKHFKNLGDEALWKSRVLRNHDSAFPLSCPTPKNHNQNLTQKSVIFFFHSQTSSDRGEKCFIGLPGLLPLCLSLQALLCSWKAQLWCFHQVLVKTEISDVQHSLGGVTEAQVTWEGLCGLCASWSPSHSNATSHFPPYLWFQWVPWTKHVLCMDLRAGGRQNGPWGETLTLGGTVGLEDMETEMRPSSKARLLPQLGKLPRHQG